MILGKRISNLIFLNNISYEYFITHFVNWVENNKFHNSFPDRLDFINFLPQKPSEIWTGPVYTNQLVYIWKYQIFFSYQLRFYNSYNFITFPYLGYSSSQTPSQNMQDSLTLKRQTDQSESFDGSNHSEDSHPSRVRTFLKYLLCISRFKFYHCQISKF